MTTKAVLASLLVLAVGCSGKEDPRQPDPVRTLDFEAAENVPGKPPPGWSPAETDGSGTPAVWSIEVDPSAPAGPKVLAVHTANIEKTFNLIVYEEATALDLDAEVSIKAGTGTDDQGGGIMFRVRDAMNYYLARWNPLEKNVRVYVIEEARRTTLGSADVETRSGWHRLGIRAKGPAIEVTFEGRSLIQVTDDRITQAGRIGLWTKADASSSFDGLSVRLR
jgi:hypothetical protein